MEPPLAAVVPGCSQGLNSFVRSGMNTHVSEATTKTFTISSSASIGNLPKRPGTAQENMYTAGLTPIHVTRAIFHAGGCPPPPRAVDQPLRLVLGPFAEQSLRQTLTISRGSLGILLDRPMSLWIMGVTAAILALGLLMRRRPAL